MPDDVAGDEAKEDSDVEEQELLSDEEEEEQRKEAVVPASLPLKPSEPIALDSSPEPLVDAVATGAEEQVMEGGQEGADCEMAVAAGGEAAGHDPKTAAPVEPSELSGALVLEDEDSKEGQEPEGEAGEGCGKTARSLVKKGWEDEPPMSQAAKAEQLKRLEKLLADAKKLQTAEFLGCSDVLSWKHPFFVSAFVSICHSFSGLQLALSGRPRRSFTDQLPLRLSRLMTLCPLALMTLRLRLPRSFSRVRRRGS